MTAPLPPGVRRLFRLPWRSRERIRDDVDDEISFHLDMRTEDLVNEGMDRRDARERAEREFGDVEGARRSLRGEDARIERTSRRRAWFDELRQDLVFAVRTLRKRPGLTVAAILTLALGVGGTTAVFSVVKAALIDPLPYERPGQLVRLYQYDVDAPSENQFVSATHFKAYRENATSFDGLATLYTYAETGADLMLGDTPERVRMLEVSADYFRVLREEPIRGRTFDRDEETGEALAILSEGLARRLGDDRARIGATIELDGEAHTVVGIMPSGFEDPVAGRIDVWTPEDLYGSGADVPGNHYLTVIGRLAPGTTPEQSRQEMAALDRGLAERWPDVADDTRFKLVTLHEDLVAGARPTLLLLMGAVGLVLLLVCVNVANLMMVRALGRAREMAVRSALGAGRGRIGRQLLTESMLLAIAGGALGVVVALLGVDALLAVGRDAIPRAAEVGLDAPVLGFAAAVTAATGLVFGLAPALRMARTAPAGSLRESSGRSSGGRIQVRVRGALVAGQVALALMLLLGASVLATSVYRLSSLDLGVRTDEVLTFELNLPAGRYGEEARATFHREMTERLERLPGVSSAAATTRLPAIGTFYRWGTRATTGPTAGGDDAWIAGEQRIVEGDYFETLDIRLVEGRVFDDRDRAGSTPVAVISASAAERMFPGTSALGHTIAAGGREREVVGVVEDVAVDPEGRPGAHIYHDHAQFAERRWAMTYTIAAEHDAESLVSAVRSEIAEVDPQLVMHEPAMLADVLGRGHSRRRFAFVLTAVFAGLALTLAVLGLYGVLAYTVSQRTREIGIRVALGAEPRRVAGMVVRHGLTVTGIGLAFGVAGALALGRALSSLVFRTQPTDPLIMAGTAVLLTLVALGAALLPAYRATRIPGRLALEDT